MLALSIPKGSWYSRLNALWLFLALSHLCFMLSAWYNPEDADMTQLINEFNWLAPFYNSSQNVLKMVSDYTHYTLWFAIGGYIATLTIGTMIHIAKEGIEVQKNYILDLQIKMAPPLGTVGKPAIIIPFIVISSIIRKVLIAFYNTLIKVANAIVRTFVFMYILMIKYFTEVAMQLWKFANFALNFILKCLRYGIIPIFATISVSKIIVDLAALIEGYVHGTEQGVHLEIIINVLILIFLLAVASVAFARHNLVSIISSVFRDIAAIIAYAIPVFAFSSIALCVTGIALKKIFSREVIPYGFGKFTLYSLVFMVIVFGIIFLLQSKKKLQEAQRGISE